MSNEIQKHLLKAYQLWLEMTGVDPESKTWTTGTWDLRTQTKEIEAAQHLDDTGLTTYMLLRSFVMEYVGNEKVSAIDLIRGLSEKQLTRMSLLRQILELLEQEDLVEFVDDFTHQLRMVGRQYGLNDEQMKGYLDDPIWVAVLRRDSFRSYKQRLESHQFSWGSDNPSTEGKFNKNVYEFWNMPSVLRAMQAQRIPGVSLILIRDPELPLHSFFCIAVANGSNLVILTDKNKDPHPDYKKMSRRPDRTMERRASRNWFPYELLDLEVSENQKYVYTKKRTGLVPMQDKATAIFPLKDLDTPTVLWWAMLAEQIRDDYFRANKKLPELSYTANMMREPHALVGVHNQLVVRDEYQPFFVEPLKREDVTAETTAEQWDIPAKGINSWMEERYGHLVPEAVFDILGEQDLMALPLPEEAQALLPAPAKTRWDRDSWTFKDQTKKALATVTDPVEKALLTAKVYGKLRQMSPLDFGTQKSLKKDRLWAARRNQAVIINNLAQQEFKETSDSILYLRNRWDEKSSGWYWRKVHQHQDRIIELMIRGVFKANSRFVDQGTIVLSAGVSWFPETPEEEINIIQVRQKKGKGYESWPYNRLSSRGICLSTDEELDCCRCPITGGETLSYHAILNVQDGHTLAKLFKMKFEDLPWQLQVWTASPLDHDGNQILDRLDPADWAIDNPWKGRGHGNTMTLNIRGSFSKRGINRRRKELDLPPLKWEV